MIFDLRGLHLGDLLLAMPAMRRGDCVMIAPAHRFDGAPVGWLDAGRGVHARPLGHRTQAWVDATGRAPMRHQLLPEAPKELVVVAPDVRAVSKQWTRWEELRLRLPGAVWATAGLVRDAWMDLLNRAHTVICPDTGTAHMADALGVPRVVALYGLGRAHFETYAPFWDRSNCLVAESMGDIHVDAVLEKVNV